MKKLNPVIVVCALMAVFVSACGSDRYSFEVGPVATPMPTAAPAPTAAPQIIIVQQPAPPPVQAPANSQLDPVVIAFLLLTMLGGGVTMGMCINYLMTRNRPAPRETPYPPFLPTFEAPRPVDELPLLNVTNHYHYHAGAKPVSNTQGEWSIGRRAEQLIAQGYTKDEAKNILDNQPRAQLPAPKRGDK